MFIHLCLSWAGSLPVCILWSKRLILCIASFASCYGKVPYLPKKSSFVSTIPICTSHSPYNTSVCSSLGQLRQSHFRECPKKSQFFWLSHCANTFGTIGTFPTHCKNL
ncbi:uncharacterized protein LY89DRAFT_505694 [Mollisia scopiformis]|uniref:Uncharacterized protein n=1 Tax=Mollisia scopiformis TaxID=149040 RepID=A0A194XF50_MOLSC|nr:uncharacterized protein LY89DRAFT_505694 [Mollisia scopiformis]KUJ18820.1 hypothetical protein LY89DRAFT_505694 [Mollisia scopiformis]